MARSPRRAHTVIDTTLLERLETIAGAAIARLPEIAYPLVSKLTSAKFLPPKRLPSSVVTIGSRVRYHDNVADRDVWVTLCWPEQANIDHGLVSVLTPVGAALLGLSVGSEFKWTNRAGEQRSLTVLEVTKGGNPSAVSPS